MRTPTKHPFFAFSHFFPFTIDQIQRLEPHLARIKSEPRVSRT